MNIKNKNIIGNIHLLSFLKRIFICFLCIILCFNFVCKPKRVNALELGVAVAWGTLAEYLAALATCTGIALTVDAFCRGLGLYGGEEEVTEEEALQWCKNNITIDGDNNVVFTDDAKAFINDYLLGTYNDSVTMVYRYPCNPSSVDASYFLSQNMYSEFIDVISSHPEYLFVITQQNMYDYPSYIEFYVIEVPFALVSGNPDLIYASCSLYNDNWTTTFDCLRCRLLCDRYSYETSWVVMKNGNTTFSSFDDITFSDYSFSRSGITASFFRSENVTFSPSTANFAVSSCPSALNCYKSEADMKKDIGSQVIGNYIPDYYTGTPNYNITTSEVNNILNNYYPSDPDDDSGGGSGSGSDDSGGSSSGGSGIIDGLGKLFGAIGNIIDKLFGFVLGLLSKVVDFFGSILEMFTETLTKLIDIIPSGFNEFLAAMFPYIPEEWITIAEFILLVSAIGCVVALFKR